MSEDAGRFPTYLKQGIQVIMFWVIAALLVLSIVSLILWKLELPSRFLAYGSALISFLSAAAVAWKTATLHKRSLLSAIAQSVLLLVFLLGAGFVLSKGKLSRDAVLSVSSFTIAGVLVGSILVPQQNRRIKSQNIHRRKAQRRKLT